MGDVYFPGDNVVSENVMFINFADAFINITRTMTVIILEISRLHKN